MPGLDEKEPRMKGKEGEGEVACARRKGEKRAGEKQGEWEGIKRVY